MLSPEEELFAFPCDVEPVAAFVLDALQQKSKGIQHNYEQILKQLHSKDDSDLLWKLYLSLSSHVTLFSRKPEQHGKLFVAIYSYRWNMDHKITICYANLLWQIVSSNVTLLSNVFDAVVKNMIPSVVPPDPKTGLLEAYNNEINFHLGWMHRIIQAILAMVPTGQTELLDALVENFPHKRFDEHVHVQYTTEILRVSSYVPNFQRKIIEAVLHRCLEIDVEIVIEESGDVKIEEEFEDPEMAMFVLDDDRDDIRGGTAVKPTRQFSDDNLRICSQVAAMARKLDAMLVLVLAYVSDIMSRSSDISLRDKLYSDLLSVFEERILTTHRCKYVQFVLFYVASRDTRFCEAFTDRLQRLFLDHRAPLIIRQSSVMYLTSFVSRCRFLPLQNVRDVLATLLGWACSYVTHTDAALGLVPGTAVSTGSRTHLSTSGGVGFEADWVAKSGLPGLVSVSSSMFVRDEGWVVDVDEFGRRAVKQDALQQHETFYYAVQALCYILCFYGVELAAEQSADIERRMRWEYVLSSRHSPLRYCLSSVRYEFLRLASAVGLLSDAAGLSIPHEFFDADETKGYLPGRCGAAVVGGGMSGSGHMNGARGGTGGTMAAAAGDEAAWLSAGLNPLDSFFPFDPCLLGTLAEHVEKSYRRWSGIPGLQNEEDEGGGGDDEENRSASHSFVSSSSCSHSMRTSDVAHSMSSVCGSPTSAASSASSTTNLASLLSRRAGAGAVPQRSVSHNTGLSVAGVSAPLSVAGGSAAGTQSTATGAYGSYLMSGRLGSTDYKGGHDMDVSGSAGGRGGVLEEKMIGEQQQIGTLADWPLPVRRPRQYSISSTGSW